MTMTSQNIKLYFHSENLVVGVATYVDALTDAQLQWNYFHLGELLNALQVTPEMYMKALTDFIKDPDKAREKASIEERFDVYNDLTVDYSVMNVYPLIPNMESN